MPKCWHRVHSDEHIFLVDQDHCRTGPSQGRPLQKGASFLDIFLLQSICGLLLECSHTWKQLSFGWSLLSGVSQEQSMCSPSVTPSKSTPSWAAAGPSDQSLDHNKGPREYVSPEEWTRTSNHLRVTMKVNKAWLIIDLCLWTNKFYLYCVPTDYGQHKWCDTTINSFKPLLILLKEEKRFIYKLCRLLDMSSYIPDKAYSKNELRWYLRK